MADKVYVYLGRRDKKGMKLLAVVDGPRLNATRLEDLSKVMPIHAVPQIKPIIHQERMMYEPWAESAPSFADLKNQMRLRGYSGLPLSEKPILGLAGKVVKFDFTDLPATKAMTRRRKD
jgi:hypothetical protein